MSKAQSHVGGKRAYAQSRGTSSTSSGSQVTRRSTQILSHRSPNQQPHAFRRRDIGTPIVELRPDCLVLSHSQRTEPLHLCLCSASRNSTRRLLGDPSGSAHQERSDPFHPEPVFWLGIEQVLHGFILEGNPHSDSWPSSPPSSPSPSSGVGKGFTS